MTHHEIVPSRATLHGHFSRDLPPVLTIDSGDRVVVSTLDAGWGMIENPDPFAPPPKFAGRIARLDSGHALCGPIAVNGARAGMTLEVRIHDVRPGRWGWSSAGGFPSDVNQRLGLAEPPEHVLRWAIDPDSALARDAQGLTLRLRPFLGVIGMPPAEPGTHSTIPPRICGGNLDCKELVAGSHLFLPIAVDGALLSVGDGHGVQGDGEVAGPALECPMERVELEIHLHASRAIALPRARTPAGWITLGFDADLDEAMFAALDGMLDVMVELLGIDRKRALALASLVVDLRVSQIVNGVRGVHALLPAERLEELRAF
jgi:acetamidase/formamidase